MESALAPENQSPPRKRSREKSGAREMDMGGKVFAPTPDYAREEGDLLLTQPGNGTLGFQVEAAGVEPAS